MLGRGSMLDMLVGFRKMYDEADMVTGHYILRHDLPILNSAYIENGLPPLDAKLVQDTKVHLLNWKDLPKTQEQYLNDDGDSCAQGAYDTGDVA